jgi:hypothetical protein
MAGSLALLENILRFRRYEAPIEGVDLFLGYSHPGILDELLGRVINLTATSSTSRMDIQRLSIELF